MDALAIAYGLCSVASMLGSAVAVACALQGARAARGRRRWPPSEGRHTLAGEIEAEGVAAAEAVLQVEARLDASGRVRRWRRRARPFTLRTRTGASVRVVPDAKWWIDGMRGPIMRDSPASTSAA